MTGNGGILGATAHALGYRPLSTGPSSHSVDITTSLLEPEPAVTTSTSYATPFGVRLPQSKSHADLRAQTTTRQRGKKTR